MRRTVWATAAVLLGAAAAPLAAQLPCRTTQTVVTLARPVDTTLVNVQSVCQVALPTLNVWTAELWRIASRPNIPGQPLAPALPTGAPFLVRIDSAINFNAGLGPLDPRYPADSNGIYIRWTRRATFDGGTYRFTATVDDGVKLFVDGVKVLESWLEQPATAYSADVPLTAGAHALEMHYYENMGGASAKLVWVRLPDPPPPPASIRTVASIKIVPNELAILVPGQSRQLWAVTSWSDGYSVAGGGALQWEAVDSTIATVTTGAFAGVVKNGLVKALKVGRTTIVARDSATRVVDSLPVQVTAGELPAFGVTADWLGFLGCPVTVGSTCTRGPYPVYDGAGVKIATVTVTGTFAAVPAP